MGGGVLLSFDCNIHRNLSLIPIRNVEKSLSKKKLKLLFLNFLIFEISLRNYLRLLFRKIHIVIQKKILQIITEVKFVSYIYLVLYDSFHL